LALCFRGEPKQSAIRGDGYDNNNNNNNNNYKSVTQEMPRGERVHDLAMTLDDE